jgi:hypothetical protein
MAAAVVLLIVLTVRRMIPVSNILCALATMAVVVVVTRMANGYLIEKGWGGGGEITIKMSLAPLTSWAGVRQALLTVAGQLFYAITTTFGLYLLGLGFMVFVAWRCLTQSSSAKDKRQAAFLAYCLACVLGVVVVASLSLTVFSEMSARAGNAPRPDFLITGRYQEGVLAVVVLMGLAFLFESRVQQELRLIVDICQNGVLVSVAVLSLVVVPQLRNLEYLLGLGPRINIFAAMGILRVLLRPDFALFAIFCLLMSWLVFYLSRRRTHLALVCVAGLFISTAGAELRTDLFGSQLALRRGLRGTGNGDNPTALGILLNKIPQAHEVGYDMATWDPLLYANYQLWSPEKDFIQFDSGSGQSPRSEVVIAGRKWHSTSGARYLVACEQLRDSCLFAPPELEKNVLPDSYKDVELEDSYDIGLASEGLYAEEGNSTFHYRWTDGNASIKVPPTGDAPPRQVEVKLAIPAKIVLKILVNGDILYDESVGPGEWSHSLSLPHLDPRKAIVIVLRSDTFVPGPSDQRTLGVQLLSLKLH